MLCLIFSITLSAQTSGGQIRRHTINQQKKTNRINTSPQKSLKQYSAEEQYEIGLSYFNKGNFKESIKWFTKAAEANYPDAQSTLGYMYLNGEGVAVNKFEAADWLKKAAENGDVAAQHVLGLMYRDGDGFIRDKSEAKKWFERAAPFFYDFAKSLLKERKADFLDFFEYVIDMDVIPYSTWSMFHLGATYYYGEGGQKSDYSKAYYYFKLAADKGNKPAQYYLGLCYEYGRGTSKDNAKAQEFYKKSGYTSAPSRNF